MFSSGSQVPLFLFYLDLSGTSHQKSKPVDINWDHSYWETLTLWHSISTDNETLTGFNKSFFLFYLCCVEQQGISSPCILFSCSPSYGGLWSLILFCLNCLLWGSGKHWSRLFFHSERKNYDLLIIFSHLFLDHYSAYFYAVWVCGGVNSYGSFK